MRAWAFPRRRSSPRNWLFVAGALVACDTGSLNASRIKGSPAAIKTAINNLLLGDGQLDVTDVFVTYVRSLDPTLNWIIRYFDANGLRTATTTNNVFPGQADLPAEEIAMVRAAGAGDEPPLVSFVADDFLAAPGQLASVPLWVQVTGNLALRVLMLNLTVQPLDGTPPLAEGVQFTPVPELGAPTFSSSQANNYAAAWLRAVGPGLTGRSLVGTLRFRVPSAATAASAYRIEFSHLSASPNGLALFPQQMQAGLVTLSNRLSSTWLDGIPDAWRFRFFGTLSNQLSRAMADADGDGVPNWAEFKAGTDPTDLHSLLRLLTRSSLTGTNLPPSIALRWLSVLNKEYVVEGSPSLTNPQWTAIGSHYIGTGRDLEFTDPQAVGLGRFYRVRLFERAQ